MKRKLCMHFLSHLQEVHQDDTIVWILVRLRCGRASGVVVDQFSFNTMIDVTLRDLETTKQGVGEAFFEYMTRWKGKASRVINRPNEKDQILMIIRNLLLTYNSRLLSSSISSFGELCDCGIRIRDAINNGQLEKGESKPPIKKTYGGGANTSKAPNLVNMSAIIPQ